jgi:hypothetical protein
MVQNQISIANEFNNYFLNIAESTSTKGINNNKKKKIQVHYNIYLNTIISHLKI